MPHSALEHQCKEAYVEVSVETGDLTHEQLNVVPLVYVEDVSGMSGLLDAPNRAQLENDGEKAVTGVDVVSGWIKPSSALIGPDHGRYEHNDVVDETVEVEVSRHRRHEFVFDHVQCVRAILEAERLVLIVHEALPAHDAADDLLPEWQMLVLMVHFERFFDLFATHSFICFLVEILLSLDVLFILQ